MKRGQIPKQGTYRSRKGKHFLISNPTKVNMSRLILNLFVYVLTGFYCGFHFLLNKELIFFFQSISNDTYNDAKKYLSYLKMKKMTDET